MNAIGLEIAFQRNGAVLASATVAFPLYVRAVRLRAEAMDAGLLDAASALGATPIRAVHYHHPSVAHARNSRWLYLGFRTLSRRVRRHHRGGRKHPRCLTTLPLAIWSSIQRPGGHAEAIQLAGVAVALSVVALVATEVSLRRHR